MERVPATLPEDVETLQALVSSLCQTNQAQQERLGEQQEKLQRQTSLIEQLVEQIKLGRHKQFGSSSEKWRDQMWLFNEAEAIVDGELSQEEADTDTIEVPAHRRKRGGRKALPPELPRIDIVHELPVSERTCAHDGAELEVIGDSVTEQLDIIPAQVRVIRHIRKKHACPCCDGTIETAKANGKEPYAYLRRVFTELPGANTVEEIEALLPCPVDPDNTDKVNKTAA